MEQLINQKLWAMMLCIALSNPGFGASDTESFDRLYTVFVEERTGSYAATADREFLDRINEALAAGDTRRSIQRDVIACFHATGNDFAAQRQMGEKGYQVALSKSMFKEAGLFQICRADAVDLMEGPNHALPLLREAVMLTEQSGNSYSTAVANVWLGSVLGLVGHSGEALATLLLAQSQFEVLGRAERARLLDIDIGILYRRVGRLDRAKQILQGLLDDFEKYESATLEDQLAVIVQLIYIFNAQNRWEEALVLSEEAKKRLGDRELLMWQSTVAAAPATALNALGRSEEALGHVETAIAMLAAIGGHQTADLELIRQESLLGLGQAEAALQLNDALGESPNLMESPLIYLEWHLIRARALAASGRHDEAYDQLLAARRLDQALQQQNNAQQLLALQASFELRDRARILEQAEAEARLKQAEINALQQAQTWQRLALIVLAILLIGMLLWGNRQRSQRRRMWDLARCDALTGLANRRGFLELADLIIKEKQPDQSGPVLLAIDLDHFKLVNDRYGHPAGDQVLVTVAGVLRASARANDLIGRLGGEEFSLMLPTASDAEGLSVAERLRHTLEGTRFDDIAPSLRLTCSIGIASVNEEGPASLGELMIRADRRLYAAKAAGRNRIVATDINPSEPVQLGSSGPST